MSRFVQMYKDDVLAMSDPKYREHPDLRWGQAIVNKYMLLGEEFNELFFTTSDRRVVEIMTEYFERYNIPENKDG